MSEFKDEEKIIAFDKIAYHYFNKNFGSLSKSDMDLIMFSEYIEHKIKNGLDYSDYSLSKELGITQNRIRTLKEKKELIYPHEGFDWKFALAESLKNAKYDRSTNSVKVLIQDVNVQIEFRNYVEQNGWFDDFSLNKKLSVIPIAAFIDLFGDEINYDDETKKSIKDICKLHPETSANEIKEFLSDFTKDGLKSFLKTASKSGIKLVLSSLPFGGIAKSVFEIIVSLMGE